MTVKNNLQSLTKKIQDNFGTGLGFIYVLEEFIHFWLLKDEFVVLFLTSIL